MSTTLKIGNREFQPGTRTTDVLNAGPYFPDAPKNYLRRVITIPYSVIRGNSEGPIFCVTAGMDPTEYAGIGAALKLSREVKPQEVKGTLIVVHVSNIPGFWERKYVSSAAGEAIQFPGNPNGKLNERIGHTIFSNCVSKANYYMDLHGSDFHESMVPHAGFVIVGDERVDIQSEEMAKASLRDYVLTFDMRGMMKSKEGQGSPQVMANLHGIPSALNEMGEGGQFSDSEITEYFDGIVNVMRHLGMLDGKPRVNPNQKVLRSGYVPFIVNQRGLFYSRVKPGAILEKGEVVGEVRDLHGETVETIRAGTKSVFLGGIHNPVVEPGQLMGMLIPL